MNENLNIPHSLIDQIKGSCFGVVILFIAFYLILGFVSKDASKAATNFGFQTCGWTFRCFFHIMKIFVMFFVNLSTLLLRMITRPDHIGNAWATFIERMADVILGF